MNNNFIEDIKEKIILAKNNKTAVLLKNIFPDTPKWDSFINHIDYQSKIESDFKGDEYYRAFGKILQRHNFYLQVPDAYNINKNIKNFFPETEIVVNFFNLVFNENTNSANSFIHFSGAEPDVGNHMDEWDNVAWQCIGKTIWEIREKENDVYPNAIFEAEPGDVVIIPDGVYHSVKKQFPRAGITFMYNVVENREYINRVFK